MQSFHTSDGVRIAFRIDDFTDPWSGAETVLVLHPAMASARRLYAMVPHLARRLRVVRMDLRGHGDSQVPPADSLLSIERLTRDVLELMDHLGVARAHFLGVAGGGYLAQQIAIHHPARAASMVLVASRPGFRQSNAADWIPEVERVGLRAFIERTIEDRMPVDEVEPGHVRWFIDQIAMNDVGWIKRFILYMTTQYWMDDLARVRCPTLMIAPGDEAIGSAGAYGEMHRRIAGSELVVYEGARHNMADYLGDRCARDAMAFFARHLSAGIVSAETAGGGDT